MGLRYQLLTRPDADSLISDFCSLARSFAPHCLQPAPRDTNLDISLTLRPHLAEQGTFTPKLCNMLDTQQKPRSISQPGFCFIQCLAMTYSHMGKPHTTIGDVSFHFRVRDGIGWFQHSMVTRQNWSLVSRNKFQDKSMESKSLLQAASFILAQHSRAWLLETCLLTLVSSFQIALALYGQASRVISTG